MQAKIRLSNKLKRSASTASILLAALSFGLTALPSNLSFAQSAQEEPEQIIGTSAAGSFLAARIASAEFDFDLAASLLQDAIEFAPEDETLKRMLMVTMLQAGQFDEASALAEEFTREEELNRITRLVLYSRYMRAKKFTAAEGIISSVETPKDLAIEFVTDRLLRAWALAKLQCWFDFRASRSLGRSQNSLCAHHRISKCYEHCL